MLENLIFQSGYAGLFIASFLSATILPLSSGALVVLMPMLGYQPWVVVLVASVGNYLGALTNYYIGKLGSDLILSKYVQVETEKIEKADRLFQRWGAPILFFSWLPVIGDALTVVGGIFKMNLGIFTFWVLLGKTLRYIALLGIVSPFWQK